MCIRDRGISKVKVELDDLALKYLQPDVYYDLVEKIALRKSAREEYVQSIVDEVQAHIIKAGIRADVSGRVKHFFSIYKKMVNQDKTCLLYTSYGLRISGRHRRKNRQSRHGCDLHQRRRRYADESSGDGHGYGSGTSDYHLRDEQRVSGKCPPVAGDVLQPPVFQHLPMLPEKL